MPLLKNIDVSEIKGSGPRGRIVKKDLDAFIDKNINLEEKNTANNALNVVQTSNKIPLTNIRKTIALRLQTSKQTIPHFYLKSKINATEMINARTILNSPNVTKSNKISYNDIIIKAVASALKLVPEMNSIWDNDSIIQYGLADISVAVATDNGLFTPVIRSACIKSITDISLENERFYYQG